MYERVVEQLAGYARALKVGDPRSPETVVGPVISAAHRERVESYVELGRKEGAVVVAGGERPSDGPGFLVAPTVLADCTAEMRVVREEIFGPVVVVVPFDSEEEGSPSPTTATTASSTMCGRGTWPGRSGWRGCCGPVGWA